jgi:hypothetical protein
VERTVISQLRIGDWIEVTEVEQREIAIVVWLDANQSQVVCVNRRGVKTHEWSDERLAELIHSGAARILDASEIPQDDKAMYLLVAQMSKALKTSSAPW